MKVSVEKYVSPSRVDINIEKHSHMDGHNVGDMIHFMGKAKVTSISKGSDHSTMGMELHSIKKLTKNMKKSGPFDHGDSEDDKDD